MSKTIHRTGDYELDNAIGNLSLFDNIHWLIKIKTNHEKKRFIGNYKEWYTCKFCDKIISPDIWFEHFHDCKMRGIFRMKPTLNALLDGEKA